MIKSNMNSCEVKKLCPFVFLTFLVLNFFTPFNGDDYLYAFNYADGSRIGNLFDVFQSQWHHYLTVNGRVIPHILEQMFAGLTGKWLFDLFNSFLCTLLLFLINRVIFDKLPQLKHLQMFLLGVTFVVSLMLFSYPGQTMFWMAGSLNYLLPTVLALIVLFLFESDKHHSLILLCFLAIISGWCQEAISIPFCASLWLLLVLDKSYRTPKHLVLALGYALGTCLIVFSPGTLSRLSTNEIQHTGGIAFIFVTKILEFNACLHNLYIYWCSLLLIIVSLLSQKRSTLLVKYRNLLLIWLLNSLFFFALGFGHERITFFLSVISFILTVGLGYELFFHRFSIKSNYLNKLVVFIMCGIVLYALKTCYLYKEWNDNLMQNVTNNAQQHVVLQAEQFGVSSKLIYAEKLDSKASSAHNKGIAKYHGKTSVQFLDKYLYESIQRTDISKKEISELFVPSTGNSKSSLYFNDNMYYIKLPKRAFEKELTIDSYHKVNNENLLPHQKFIRGLLNTLDDGKGSLNHCIVHCSDGYYCFIPNIPQNVLSFSIKINKEESNLYEFERKL